MKKNKPVADVHLNDWIIFPYLRVYVDYADWGILFGWLFIEFFISWARKDPYWNDPEGMEDE